MPREKESYRDNLASIMEFLYNKYHDGRHFLSMTDVQLYVGRSYEFVRNHFGINKDGISAERFARMLS